MEEKKVIINDENINASKEEQAGIVAPPDDNDGKLLCC